MKLIKEKDAQKNDTREKGNREQPLRHQRT